ncbi:ADYC domain-containing protein [Microvirga puerhi]|uniref:ADYC domain-containing protein n=1 Tax=Microvirga puerhi TaxID=2876078 RepID=A0ABS7VN75_9HYPH|nr:ADYC domain-containing protein [Microvirga puerhi]MBZ6076452.1 hypothetical protein [Microvirga puerhi]
MRHLTRIVLGLLLSLGFSNLCSALDGSLRMDGADLALHLEDGRVLMRDGLVGLTLNLATGSGNASIHIDSVAMDDTAIRGPIALFSLSQAQPDGASENICQPDPKGRRLALALPDENGGFSFTCTSGAEGKCVLMGYRPWESRDGVPLKDLHRACIHMLRADYGGDDHPTTRNGTLVDIYDRFGIQTSEPNEKLSFEAAWGPDGALCVAHPRIPENITLSALAERYPRFSGHLGPDSCTEQSMRAEPRALLFNRSAADVGKH